MPGNIIDEGSIIVLSDSDSDSDSEVHFAENNIEQVSKKTSGSRNTDALDGEDILDDFGDEEEGTQGSPSQRNPDPAAAVLHPYVRERIQGTVGAPLRTMSISPERNEYPRFYYTKQTVLPSAEATDDYIRRKRSRFTMQFPVKQYSDGVWGEDTNTIILSYLYDGDSRSRSRSQTRTQIQFSVGDFLLARKQVGADDEAGFIAVDIGEVVNFKRSSKKEIVFRLRIYIEGRDTILGDCATSGEIYQTDVFRNDLDLADLLEKIEVNTTSPNSLTCKYAWDPARCAFVDRVKSMSKVTPATNLDLEVGDYIKYRPSTRNGGGTKTLCNLGRIVEVRHRESLVIQPVLRYDIQVFWWAHHQATLAVDKLSKGRGRRRMSAEDKKANIHRIYESMIGEAWKDNKCVYLSKKKVDISVKDIGGRFYVSSERDATKLGRDLRKCNRANATQTSVNDFDAGLECVRDTPDFAYLASVKSLDSIKIHLPGIAAMDPPQASSYTEFTRTQVKLAELSSANPVVVWDLCCGAGILAEGSHQVGGFDITFACDIDPRSVAAYRANFGKTTNCIARSIGELVENHPRPPPASSKKFLIMAGIPCQGFSRMNRNPQFDDSRNVIIFEVLSLIYA